MPLRIAKNKIPKFGEFDLRIDNEKENVLVGVCFSYLVKKEGTLKRELIKAITQVVAKHNAKKAVKND